VRVGLGAQRCGSFRLADLMTDDVADVVQQGRHDELVRTRGGGSQRGRLQLVLDHRHVLAEVLHAVRRGERNLDRVDGLGHDRVTRGHELPIADR
jgi:hypothetical protein